MLYHLFLKKRNNVRNLKTDMSKGLHFTVQLVKSYSLFSNGSKVVFLSSHNPLHESVKNSSSIDKNTMTTTLILYLP